MIDYIRNNVEWLVPIIVAVIGGVFALLKKNGTHNQTIKNVENSNITNIGGDVTINNNKD